MSSFNCSEPKNIRSITLLTLSWNLLFFPPSSTAFFTCSSLFCTWLLLKVKHVQFCVFTKQLIRHQRKCDKYVCMRHPHNVLLYNLAAHGAEVLMKTQTLVLKPLYKFCHYTELWPCFALNVMFIDFVYILFFFLIHSFPLLLYSLKGFFSSLLIEFTFYIKK